ncbi:MAG: hypothetical protein ABSA75_03400 [Candidatus Bathyarchaeia archaeon]|jgi:hypothetical protein
MGKGKNSLLMRCLVIVIVVIFAISLTANNGKGNLSNPFSVTSTGYPTAFIPNANFYGILYNNMEYTSVNTHSGSEHTFDTALAFDPDGISSGKPKIEGEMTSVYIPQNSVSSGVPSWVPENWLLNSGSVSNPMTGSGGVNPPWSWTINNQTYSMQEYDMRFDVTFNAAWSGTQSGVVGSQDFSTGEAPSLTGYEMLAGITNANLFQNVQVWIHFDITPTWYIQGGGNGYLAIAELRASEPTIMQSKDINGHTYASRGAEAVTPEDQGSIVTLYYGPFGTVSGPTGTPEQYEGLNLNPAYFTSDIYAHIDLNNFGVQANPVNGISSRVQGDTATFEFDVIVFAFGQYTVQDIQNNPSQYGRLTPVQEEGINWLSDAIGWLSSPANDSILVIVGIVILLIIFAPWVLVAIISIFGGKK